jgi:hypothetical protein
MLKVSASLQSFINLWLSTSKRENGELTTYLLNYGTILCRQLAVRTNNYLRLSGKVTNRPESSAQNHPYLTSFLELELLFCHDGELVVQLEPVATKY